MNDSRLRTRSREHAVSVHLGGSHTGSDYDGALRIDRCSRDGPSYDALAKNQTSSDGQHRNDQKNLLHIELFPIHRPSKSCLWFQSTFTSPVPCFTRTVFTRRVRCSPAKDFDCTPLVWVRLLTYKEVFAPLSHRCHSDVKLLPILSDKGDR